MDKCDRYLRIIENFQFCQTKLYEFQQVAEVKDQLLDSIYVEKKYDQDHFYELSLSLEPRASEISKSQMEKTLTALQKTGIL